jgi:hypothetical protein
MDNIEEKIIGVIDYLSSTIIFDFIIDKIKINYSHQELFMSYLKNNSNILHTSAVKQARNKKSNDSRAKSSRQSLNAVVIEITKVRPQDPACVAWYTHLDALC